MIVCMRLREARGGRAGRPWERVVAWSGLFAEPESEAYRRYPLFSSFTEARQLPIYVLSSRFYVMLPICARPEVG